MQFNNKTPDKTMKTENRTTVSLRKQVGRSVWQPDCLAILLALVYLAFAQVAEAVLPAPDGGYAGWNTAEGSGALFKLNLTSGKFNTAVGAHALYGDITNDANTAVGAFALAADNPGDQNVAVGQNALQHNTGSGNVAAGYQTLFNNTSSGNSSAFGHQALFHQTTGSSNSGFGWHALYNNLTGGNNTAIGYAAGSNITGSGNVDIGAGVGGFANESNTTRIRNINTTQLTGQMVVVDANGKLGYVASSRRYKEDIEPMDNASEALFSLKPVTFRYKGDIDPDHVKMFGLIAEEVAEVNPDLVVRNAKGEVDSIRFDSINAMLLNEFLKQHRKVQGIEVSIAQQKKDFESRISHNDKEIQSLATSVREQAAQIQKVSARLEAGKPAPQVVANQ
jgi:Chaperone of endosialidase